MEISQEPIIAFFNINISAPQTEHKGGGVGGDWSKAFVPIHIIPTIPGQW